MADGVELAVAWINLVPSTKGIAAQIQKEMGGPLEAAAKTSGARVSQSFAGSFASRSQSLGKAMTKNLTVPILAIGALAVASAVQLNGAYHTIEQRTGATGAKLRGLKADFDSVNRGSGASMSHIADVVSQFNQRLGLSGAPLRDLTKEFLVLERVAGPGAPAVDAVAKAMVAWKVSTRDQATELDHLFVASQRTGTPMATLVDDVTKFAPQMRAAGMSIDSTTVLMGTLEKAGVPVSKVFMGINTYLSKIAKSGGDTNGAFQKLITQAAGLDAAGKKVQATTLLVDAFGSRAGLTIAQLVADGKLTGPVFAELSKAIAGSKGEIVKVGNATMPLSVRMKQAWKSIELAMAPIGNVIIPDLMSALHDVVPVVNSVTGAFSHIPHAAQTWSVGLLAALALSGPAISIVGKLAGGLKTVGAVASVASRFVWGAASSALEAAGSWGALGAVVGSVAIGVTGAVTGIRSVGQASARAGKEIKGLKPAHFDQTSVKSLDDYARRLRNAASQAENADHKYHGFWNTIRYGAQTVLPGVTHTAMNTGFAMAKLADAADAVFAQKVALQATYAEVSRLTGKSTSDVEKYLRQFNINPMGKSQATVAAQLTAALAAVGAQAKLTGGDTKSAAADLTGLAKAMSDTSGAFYKNIKSRFGGNSEMFRMQVADMAEPLNQAIAEFGADPAAWQSAQANFVKGYQGVRDTVNQSGAITGISDELAKKGVSGFKLYYANALTQAQDFTKNIAIATKEGLNAQSVGDLLVAGPEKAAVILQQLAGKHGQTLVNMVNVYSAAMKQEAEMAAAQMRIQEIAMRKAESTNQQSIRDMGKANALEAATQIGAKPITPSQLMAQTGMTPAEAKRVGAEFAFHVPIIADPPTDLERTMLNIKKLMDASAPVMKLDVDPSLAMQSAIATKWKISAMDAALTIDGIPTKAIEALTHTKVKIDSTTGTVTLDAQQKAALLKLTAVQNAINSGKGWINIDAKTAAAMAKLGEIRTTINGIPFVGSILAASLFAHQNKAEGQRAAAGQSRVANADGNLFERHTAQIAPAGAMRLWAEPETGGESYIPHAASKRARSIDIWKKTGMILGVRGFADGGTAWVDGNAIASPSIGAIDQVVKSLKSQAGNVGAAQAFAQAQVGKPYVWGATGPNAYDCSGLWSAIINVLHGRNPYSRLFTSASLPGSASALGLVPGPGGPVSIGDKPGSHVAGTINGVNFEATPPFVRSGPSARGASSPFFDRQFHMGAGFTGATAAGGDFGAVTPAQAISGDLSGLFPFADGGMFHIHERSFDEGGVLYPGWNMQYNGTGGLEHLAPTGPGARRGDGPLVAIEHYHANEGADVDLLVQKLDWRVMATAGIDG